VEEPLAILTLEAQNKITRFKIYCLAEFGWDPISPFLFFTKMSDTTRTAGLETLCAHGFEEVEATLALDVRDGDPQAALLLLLWLLSPAKDVERAALFGTGAVTDYLAVKVSDAEADLKRFVSNSTHEVDGTAAAAEDAAEALQEECTALEAIFDDAFSHERLAIHEQVLRLRLPELPVPGTLVLIIPAGCRYPHEPALPLFTPSDPAALSQHLLVSLHRRLAEEAKRLAEEQASPRASLALPERFLCAPKTSIPLGHNPQHPLGSPLACRHPA
jgi:hypothetical protein